MQHLCCGASTTGVRPNTRLVQPLDSQRPDHPDGWLVRGPSPIPYGGKYSYPVHERTVDEIKAIHRSYADVARRALDAGFEWLELHFAPGYRGASFFSLIANKRIDDYGGSLDNCLRFHLEAIAAVRDVWPERLPLTMRLGSVDLNAEGVQFDDAIYAVARIKEHGLDFADLSIGFNTDDLQDAPFAKMSFMVGRAKRLRDEVGIPVGVSWNLGLPVEADRVIRAELIDLVFLGHPALSNPHWPSGRRGSCARTIRSDWSPGIGAGGCAISGPLTPVSADRLRRNRAGWPWVGHICPAWGSVWGASLRKAVFGVNFGLAVYRTFTIVRFEWDSGKGWRANGCGTDIALGLVY